MCSFLLGVTTLRAFTTKAHWMHCVDIFLCVPKLLHLFLGCCYEHAPTFAFWSQIINRMQKGAEPHASALFELAMFIINVIANVLVDVVKVILDLDIKLSIRGCY